MPKSRTRLKAATEAAAIWDQLEQELPAMGLNPDKLLVSRATMIRIIGDALAGRVAQLRNLPATAVENNQSATAGAVRESKRARPAKATAPEVAPSPVGLPVLSMRDVVGWERHKALETAIGRRLDQLLDAAVGYSGDDSVRYD